MKFEQTIIRLFAFLVLLSAVPERIFSAKPIKYRVISLQVGSQKQADEYAPWAERCLQICRKLHHVNADIVVLQGVDSLQLSDIIQGLPEYTVVTTKPVNGVIHSSVHPILYNSKRLRVLDRGSFSVDALTTEYSNVVADSTDVSWVYWSMFQDIKNGISMLAANTAMATEKDASRLKNWANAIKTQLSKMTNKTPVLLTVSMLQDDSHPFYPIILSRFFQLEDSRKTADKVKGPMCTYNQWGQQEEPGLITDYLFASPSFHVSRFTVSESRVGERYYSSHHALIAEMKLDSSSF